MFRFFSIAVMALFLFTATAFSQYSDLPHDKNQFNLGFLKTGESTSLSTTLVLPVTGENGFKGWIGAYTAQSEASNAIIARTNNVHLQGGMHFASLDNLGVEGFIDISSDLVKGTDREIEVGAFLRPGIYENGAFRLSGGFGNFLESTDVRAELELTEADGTVSRWLAYTSFHFGNLGVLAKATPHYRFEDFQCVVEGTLGFSLTGATSIRFHAKTEYDSEPITKSVETEVDIQVGTEF